MLSVTVPLVFTSAIAAVAVAYPAAVVNTCTVTENGDKDTKRLVKQLVGANQAIKIALIGCQSQVHKDALLRLKNVQWVIGNAEKMNTHGVTLVALKVCSALFLLSGLSRIRGRCGQFLFCVNAKQCSFLCGLF